MKKISFLGLSGSGKTCYLYAASHLLGQGIHTREGSISVVSADTGRSVILNNGFKEMDGECPVWPKGTSNTMFFPFELYINGISRMNFEICDYRGGVLYDTKDESHDQRQSLYRESSCVVIFIDAYTLMRAFRLKNETDICMTFKRGDVPEFTYSEAMSELNHLKVVINEARRAIRQDIPILLTITKKDILLNDELYIAIEKLKSHMDILFSSETPNPIGITAVSLGSNLGSGELNQGGQKKILGQMHLSVVNNIHIPILFPLFLDIDMSLTEKCIAAKLFNSGAIQLYIKGKRAVISF